jgi:hypothetical protein
MFMLLPELLLLISCSKKKNVVSSVDTNGNDEFKDRWW